MATQTSDLIIIGAGIAGLTAAIYAQRAGKSVLVFEAKIPGGQIVQAHDVRNWPGAERISGETLSQNVYHQAQALGTTFIFDPVLSVTAKNQPPVFNVKTDDTTYHAKALIVATGSHDKPLGLPNESNYLNHGLSYCATCDGALFKDQDIAVVGGGNTAFYDVLYLADLAHKIYLVHRRHQFRADATLVDKVKQLSNVEMVLGWVPHSLKGDPNLTTLELIPSSSADTSDQHSPKTRALSVSGLFVAIGRIPSTALVQSLVQTDPNGYIVADENGATSHPGLFVAGDCRTKSVRQLVTAASDGATAATSAVNYLNQV